MKIFNVNSFSSLFFGCALLFFSYSFINKPGQPKANEYLTMVVWYEAGSQFISVSENGDKFKEYVFIKKDIRPADKARLKNRPGISWEEKEINDLFDNRHIIAMIQQLEQKGWAMQSHDFSIAQSASETDISEYRNAERVSYYLFRK